jgi:hypothetical protein
MYAISKYTIQILETEFKKLAQLKSDLTDFMIKQDNLSD